MADRRDIFVQTGFGPVRGAADGGVAVFHAIPYAAPPVGALRFAAPVDAIPWRDVRDCTKVGASAPQIADIVIGGVMGVPPPFAQSEDCLTLSVWTPAPDAALRPVFVWIHGGAFNHGSGAWPCYSGEVLARRGDIVIVVINYRLGALGYLQLPRDDAKAAAPANRGLLDQMKALRWVQVNIATFGGDPNQITVGGESAGGASTLALLAFAESRKLMRRAIMESPPVQTQSVDRAREVARRFLSHVGVPDGDVTKLQELPVSAILEAQRTLLAHAVASGDFTEQFNIVTPSVASPKEPGDVAASGAASPIPLLIGTNQDEANTWIAQNEKIDEATDWDIVEKGLKALGVAAPLPADAEAKWKASGKKPWQVLSATLTEAVFRKPVGRIADGHANHGGEAYVYRFDWRPTPQARLGACHMIEVPFVFNNLPNWRAAPMLADCDPSSFTVGSERNIV